MFGELEGNAIHFIYKARKFTVSFCHMGITAREFSSKREKNKTVAQKNNNPVDQSKQPEARVSEPHRLYAFINKNKHEPINRECCLRASIQSPPSPDAAPS